jgi:HTH-type transcriptional regulator/antitoxin HigA
MTDRNYAEVFPPGEYLKDELETRGWSQVELAEILGRSPRVVSEIISGKRAISPETAKGLAAALGTSAEVWMNLEAAFQLSQANVETSLVERRARLYRSFPVKELIRRKWVSTEQNLEALEKNFCRFFGVPSVEQTPTFAHAAKKTEYVGSIKVLQLAWLIRAEKIAEEQQVGVYSVAAIKEAIKKLKTCMSDLASLCKVPKILNDAGVRFVVVESLAGAKLDGACFWIKKKSPVIALSLRLDRIDNFWHTLLHEVDHVLNGEGKEDAIVDVFDHSSTDGNSKPDIEVRANSAAAHYCIDQGHLEKWLQDSTRIPTKESIIEFASSMNVHPAIVVGQLQFRNVIPYSYHRDLLEKVRSVIIECMPSDGFGIRQEDSNR